MEQELLIKFNIWEGGKPYHGVKGILPHYHLRCDTYIDIGVCTIIRIPFSSI